MYIILCLYARLYGYLNLVHRAHTHTHTHTYGRRLIYRTFFFFFFFTQCYSHGVFFIQFRRSLYIFHRRERRWPVTSDARAAAGIPKAVLPPPLLLRKTCYRAQSFSRSRHTHVSLSSSDIHHVPWYATQQSPGPRYNLLYPFLFDLMMITKSIREMKIYTRGYAKKNKLCLCIFF
jgi:hypothetical protein